MHRIRQEILETSLFSYIYNNVMLIGNIIFEQKNEYIYCNKIYWLYYFIQENYRANMNYLCGLQCIENENMGFIPIWRNIRNSIEAYIDLYNLKCDKEYIEVLRRESEKKCKVNSTYENYIGTRGIPKFNQKYKIAIEVHGLSNDGIMDLEDIYKKSNKYVHSNVFIDIIENNDLNRKMDVLRSLLKLELEIFTRSYEIQVEEFYGGNKPLQYPKYCNGVNCKLNMNCEECYNQLLKLKKKLLNEDLFEEYSVFPYSYKQPEQQGKYVIWGIGMYGKQAIDMLGIDNVSAFIDYRYSDFDAMYQNKPVITLEKYITTYSDKVLVVTPKHNYDIVELLREHGIANYVLYEDIIC